MSEPTRDELLHGIVKSITRFDRECTRVQHTDTGEAWQLLLAVRAAARLALSLPDETAATLGRRGGKKGGVERIKRLSAQERSDIARAAAMKRWHGV